MTNLLSRLFGRAPTSTEKRYSLAEAASIFGPSADPFSFYRAGQPASMKNESNAQDFVSMINQTYKVSGVLFAVMQARASIFSEARFMYRPFNKGKPEDRLFSTPDLSIFEEPWENGTTGDLLMRAIQDADLCGNHYAITEGEGEEDKRIRRLRPDWVTIVLTKDPKVAVDADVDGYLYRPGNTSDKTKWVYYPADGSNGAIAHWAPIPDPDAMYRGMSWITPVLNEITSDKLATKHKLKFFENGATPQLAVSLKETVTTEEFKDFMKETNQSHNGVDNAYRTIYLGGGADVTVVGANIQELDFKVTQGAAETRIAAAGRVHPAIVGLSEGLQGSSLNASNFGAAKSNFGDGTLRPLWRSLCAAYSVLVPRKPGAQLWFDSSDISFLRQDRKEQADLQKQQQAAIVGYVMNGFEPQSAVDAINNDDLSLLVHTGLVSVQLLPPGTVADGQKSGADAEDDDVDPDDPDGKKKAEADADPKVKNAADLKAKAAAAAAKKQGTAPVKK